MAHIALQSVDALFQGDRNSLPFTVILDYCYGIAAYSAWCSNPEDSFNIMATYRNEHYAFGSATPDGIHDINVPRGLDPSDSDSSGSEDLYTATRMDATMDKLNRFLMHMSGITPEMAAEREKKAVELEERAAQEASRSKVLEWRDRLCLP